MKRFMLIILLVVVGVPSLVAQTFTKLTLAAGVPDSAASRSVNWVDYNGDGFLDLYVSNGKRGGERSFLYTNNKNGTFAKITGDPIVTHALPYDGASWADADNDGDIDCFATAWYDSNKAYFQNNGNGSFSRPNIGTAVNDKGFSETCSWGDYDNDGRADIYVSNSAGNRRNFLYRNTAAGFIKVDTGAIVTDQLSSRGVSWVDYDDDGDVDIYVVNEENQQRNLCKNMLKETGTAWFQRVTTGALVTDVTSALSASWADYDNDGDLDVFVANGLFPQNDNLYVNNGNGTFTKITTGDAVNDGAHSISSAWGDFDNDGDLDLYVTTGYSGTLSKNLLYVNLHVETGTATLQKVTTGDIANDAGNSYGAAFGDYDRDGDLDLFVARTTGERDVSFLYRNDNTNGNHWLTINCVGTVSNKSGLGAKVRIKATINGTPVRQLRIVEGQSGYCGQNLQLHVGLGNATTIDSLEIEWPSGIVESYANVAVDRMLNAVEQGGLASAGQLRNEVPVDFELHQNYPNPFNPGTTLSITLGRSSRISLKVFDILGKEIAIVLDDELAAGDHIRQFSGENLSSGVYFYRLSAGTATQTRQMVLLK